MSLERTNTVTKPLDLTTLNAASGVVRSALRNQVCDYAQKAVDAARNGDYLGAQTYKNWAFAADMCVHTASGAISALFCALQGTMHLVKYLNILDFNETRAKMED